MHNCHGTFSLRGALFAPLLLLLLLGRLPAQSQSITPPQAASSTIVPFDLVGNHIVLTVMLDGRGPYWFALDTGAYNCLTAKTARALGVTSRRTRLASVQTGSLQLTEESFAVVPLPDIEAVEGVTPFGGLIGSELFRRYVVRIDYERHLLTLTPPQSFHFSGGGVERDLTFFGHIPQITARLDGVDGAFNIDTGDRRSLAVFRDFRARCSARTKPTVEAITGWGVRGPVWSELGRAQTFGIGDAVIPKPLVEFDEAKGGAFDFPHTAGNIGGCLLEQFTVTLDYSRRQAFFEKSGNFGQPILWDRSGMWLNQEGAAFKVVDVTPGGPAALAGLRAGDRVTAVDGQDAAQLSLAAVRLRLRQSAPGSRVRFTVRPEGSALPRDLVLTLRELV